MWFLYIYNIYNYGLYIYMWFIYICVWFIFIYIQLISGSIPIDFPFTWGVSENKLPQILTAEH